MRPDFTRRNYMLVAQVLHSTMPPAGVQTVDFHDQWERTCLAFLNHFRADNPAFDGDRFLAACKGEKHGTKRR
jgi:hypothetical protein